MSERLQTLAKEAVVLAELEDIEVKQAIQFWLAERYNIHIVTDAVKLNVDMNEFVKVTFSMEQVD